jgi:pimeloyl-ACP methyl ester carboxylesterase
MSLSSPPQDRLLPIPCATAVRFAPRSQMDELRIPIWGEARVALEHAALLRHPIFRGDQVPRGDGAPVLLIPGFLAGDSSLTLMAKWLRRIGYEPCAARIRLNVDCLSRAVDRLEDELDRIVERHDRRVAIVGQSRGGMMARVLAVRRPDAVEAVVCLGSPVVDQLSVHPVVRANVETVALLGSLGVRGLFSRRCRSGDCCAHARAQAAESWPEGIRFTSVYSRSDGIVNWRACLDPAAHHVEVRSSHVGMGLNPDVLRVVAEALAEPLDKPREVAPSERWTAAA